MARVIQPAGFTRLNLLHIGLNDDFDEVVFVCSPESMNELEYDRIVTLAKELGSNATFSRHVIPVVGAEANVADLVQNLKNMQDDLEEKETVISTTGGMLKLGACLSYIFSECETIAMHWKEEVFMYSDGRQKPMKKLLDDIAWKLLGLRHDIKNNKNQLYHQNQLVATPSSVSLKKGKLHLKWENKESRKGKKTKQGRKYVPASDRAKVISREMGHLNRINSEHRYEFSVPFAKFTDYDRYPINTIRTIQPSKFFKEISNEFFSRIPMPVFPTGQARAEKLCLHIIFNTSDITPTAEAILAHQPDYVVLWYLEDSQNDAKIQEYGGKLAFLTSFIHGDLMENLSDFPNIKKSPLLQKNPLEKMSTEFHLAKLSSLNDASSISNFPKAERTILETNSGFIGFQDRIIRQLGENKIEFERWYTDLISAKTSIISFHSQELRTIDRDVARSLLLRKRIPTKGDELSTTQDYFHQLSIVLEAVLSSKKLGNDEIWRPSKGEYDVNGNTVRIATPKFEKKKGKKNREIYPYEFEIFLNDNHFIKFGEAKTGNPKDDTTTLGLWLEELTAHMIHVYWKSKYTIIGLNSHPFTGNPMPELGTNDDIDVYALTQYGEVISEVKAIRSTEPKELIPHLGQLYGELSVVGFRHGQVPLLTIGTDTDHLDAFAKSMKVVITNWWELQYPERILHRLRTGQRTQEELEEKEAARKAAEEARREEQNARKAEELQLAQEALDAETMFSGQISLEQVDRYQDSEAAFVMRGVPELDNAIISVAKSKFKVLFDPAKNRTKWSGYNVTVKSTIPEEISSRENFVEESTAYLENLKTIELSEEE